MWLTYYGHDLEESHKQHSMAQHIGDAPSASTVAPKTDVLLDDPVHNGGIGSESRQPLYDLNVDNVCQGFEEEFFCSDGKPFPPIGVSLSSEEKLNENYTSSKNHPLIGFEAAMEKTRSDMLDGILVQVKTSIREELAVVLTSVEALRSAMTQKQICTETQIAREISKTSQDCSSIDIERRGEVTVLEMQPVEGAIKSESLASSSAMPCKRNSLWELEGGDLRGSLLSTSTHNDAGGYLPLDDDESNHDSNICADAEALTQEIEQLSKDERETNYDLQTWEAHYQKRHSEMSTQLAHLRERRARLQKQLDMANDPDRDLDLQSQEIVAGPRFLSWVDSTAFSTAGMIVIALNLALMVTHPSCCHVVFWICDQFFLVWYLVELALKYARHKQALFYGDVHTVWWNWLDLCIVVCGILDQWIVGLWEYLTHSKSIVNFQIIRLARIFRLLRALRFIRLFVQSDTSWSEGPLFRNILLSTISANSMLMPLELDFEWQIWLWFENIFLVIYTIEIVVRLKSAGVSFFRFSTDSASWNYIDLSIVVGGILDLWLIPLAHAVQTLVLGKQQKEVKFFEEARIFLKALRIVRILRLVRLMREMKPLYVLFTDFWRSVKAMQWVLLLTFLVLYAGAIVFTDLIGKGHLYVETESPEGASDYFGSFSASMFSLFMLMNGDSTVVQPITSTLPGQILYASFMVISNWSLLAIMTSTVSDHLISTSVMHKEHEDKRKHDETIREQALRLSAVFRTIDHDNTGFINKEEWSAMMNDRMLCEELCSAANLDVADLEEFFRFLSEDVKLHSRHKGPCINYDIFMRALHDEKTLATKRSIFHLLSHVRHVESQLHKIEGSFDKRRLSHMSSGLVRRKVVQML